MRPRTRRIQLHGDAGVENLPPRAEVGGDLVERQHRAVHRGEESLRAVDRAEACRHSRARQYRGGDAIARREAGVQRLHHRAEVLLEARRLRCSDRQRAAGGGRVEAEQT